MQLTLLLMKLLVINSCYLAMFDLSNKAVGVRRLASTKGVRLSEARRAEYGIKRRRREGRGTVTPRGVRSGEGVSTSKHRGLGCVVSSPAGSGAAEMHFSIF